MADIFITKDNRKQFMGAKGSYSVVDSGGNPVLKSNGKPWAGKTFSMGNYYGVIVGSGKYQNVKLGAIWKDGYKIKFEPSPDKQIKC